MFSFSLTRQNAFSIILLFGSVLCFFTSLMTSCQPVNSQPFITASTSQKTGITTAISIDYSESVDGITRAGMPELILFTDSILASGKEAVVVFDAISSPSDQALVRLYLKPLIPSTRLSLAQRSAISKQNRERLKSNRQAAIQFLRECRQRIAWAVSKAPEKQTDINGFLEKVAMFHNEPGVKDFRHFVFIQSDGDQDVLVKQNGRLIKNRILKCMEWKDDVSVFTCNWKAQKRCGIDQEFESVQGFLDHYFKQIKR